MADAILNIRSLRESIDNDSDNFVWHNRLLALETDQKSVETLCDHLFFSAIKNVLVVFENVLHIKGLVYKPNFMIASEYRRISQELLIKLLIDSENNINILVDMQNKFPKTSYKYLEILNIWRIMGKNETIMACNVSEGDIKLMLMDLNSEMMFGFGYDEKYVELLSRDLYAQLTGS